MLKHTQTHKPAMCDAPCTKAEKKLHMHAHTPLAAGNDFLRYYISHVSLGLCFLVFASVHNPCSWCAFASHETDPFSWHASSSIPAVSLTRTRLSIFFISQRSPWLQLACLWDKSERLFQGRFFLRTSGASMKALPRQP